MAARIREPAGPRPKKIQTTRIAIALEYADHRRPMLADPHRDGMQLATLPVIP